MDVGDTFVFLFSIVDGMALLFLTVYFVSSMTIHRVRCATSLQVAVTSLLPVVALYNLLQMLTGVEVCTEKLCPEVV